jgi:hypothetical protein
VKKGNCSARTQNEANISRKRRRPATDGRGFQATCILGSSSSSRQFPGRANNRARLDEPDVVTISVSAN